LVLLLATLTSMTKVEASCYIGVLRILSKC